jgi:hypothetical protein
MNIDIPTVVRNNPDGILPGILDFLRIVELIIPDVEIESICKFQGEANVSEKQLETITVGPSIRGSYAFLPMDYLKKESTSWVRQNIRLYAPTEAHPRILRMLRDHYGNKLINLCKV